MALSLFSINNIFMNIKIEIKRHNYDIKSLNEYKRQNVDVIIFYFCLNHYGLVSHKYDLPKQSVIFSLCIRNHQQ